MRRLAETFEAAGDWAAMPAEERAALALEAERAYSAAKAAIPAPNALLTPLEAREAEVLKARASDALSAYESAIRKDKAAEKVQNYVQALGEKRASEAKREAETAERKKLQEELDHLERTEARRRELRQKLGIESGPATEEPGAEWFGGFRPVSGSPTPVFGSSGFGSNRWQLSRGRSRVH